MNTSSAQIRKWIHERNVPRLREIVVGGQGSRLMQETASSATVRKFLSSVPSMMESISEIHRAAVEGSVRNLEPFRDEPDLLISKDEHQLTPLHKAVGLGHLAVVKFLSKAAPESLTQTDAQQRIPLHMCAAVSGTHQQKLAVYELVKAGSDEHHEDQKGHTPFYYLTHPNELKVDLNHIPRAPRTSNNSLTGARSPPKTAAQAVAPRKSATPDNASTASHKSEGSTGAASAKQNLLELKNVTDDQIDQWLRSGNIAKLHQLVLQGYSDRLLKSKAMAVKNPQMKLFWNNLDSYSTKAMFIFTSVGVGNLQEVMELCDACPEFPLGAARNASGATPLHQAAIHGYSDIVAYLLKKLPHTITLIDLDKRTPLHYAALGKDRDAARDIFKLLLAHGADRTLKDAKGNTADVYLQAAKPLTAGERSRQGTAAKKAPVSRQHTPVASATIARSRTAPTPLVPKTPEKHFEKQKSANDLVQFRTQEGSYLAQGDVLKEGLAQVAVQKPEDPVAFLAEYLQEYSQVSDSKSQIDYHEEKPAPEVRQVSYQRDAKGQTELHRLAGQSRHPDEPNPRLKDIFARNDPLYIAVRDGKYQTARDIALQLKCYGNAVALDEVLVRLAAAGQVEKLEELLLEGYDHILDAEDSSGNNILFVAEDRGQKRVVKFLRSIMGFEEKREWLHKAIRVGSLGHVKDILTDSKLASAKNIKRRNCLHIAILVEELEIAEYIVSRFPATASILDNLGRTPLHYAMGMYQADVVVRALLKAGATKDTKDWMGRTPSYYFANKQEIEALQDDELKMKP